MSTAHLRTIHELNRDHPQATQTTLFREFHYQRVDAIKSEDSKPQLLLHLIPSDASDASRLIDLPEVEKMPVPVVCRPFRPGRLAEYVDSTWNRVVTRSTNRQDLGSEAILYDTGVYEAAGSGLCYPLDSSRDCEYAISSQDLELGFVTVLEFYRDVLPAEHADRVYAVCSGTNLTNATMDQHRRVDRVEPFTEAARTSRLTAIDLTGDDGLHDQLTPLLRPFSPSQSGYSSEFYYGDGEWELAEHLK